jgi:hypothetical protein
MAINTSWKLEIGTLASPTNFTSRVMSMNIRQTVDVNVIGRGQAVFTLLNKDGALTPGGGGTYSSTDWFAQGVFITALTNTGGADTSTAVFHGVVVDFDLQDDGVYSTVTITAVDGLTVAAKTVAPILQSAATYSSYYSALVDRNGIVFPRLGQTNAEGIVTSEYDTTQPTVGLAFAQTIYPTTYADALQTYLIPSVNDVTWPTTITTSASITNYNIISLGSNTTRSTANRVTFVFDPSGSVSGTDLPFATDTFAQAFNNDTLITQAEVQGAITGSTEQTSTASTNTSYGNRTVAYTSTLNQTDAEALTIAQRLTNRYSTSQFTPVSLSLSATMVKARCANAAETTWDSLLGITSGLWQKTTITWTGSGASSQTANCVIRGRTINVTPSDTVVTLNLTNWVDNHGFILDTDKLDTDRLG